jgi:hypothetical protein
VLRMRVRRHLVGPVVVVDEVTAWPEVTVTDFGLTPAEVIVIVAALGPVPPSRTITVTPPLGEVLELPQPAARAARERTRTGILMLVIVKRTFSKC